MKVLRLHNTLSRKKEDFIPIDPGHVRVYACGPTVYGRIHVGNARPIVVFDVLVRLLRQRHPKSLMSAISPMLMTKLICGPRNAWYFN